MYQPLRIVICLLLLHLGGVARAQTQQFDFSRQIIPILTQAGCNAGACHGAAAGRGYLSLSLFGSRPLDDYAALVRNNRFVDLQRPESSLLLLKPGGLLEHGGGLRIDPDQADYNTIHQWIQGGCAAGPMAELKGLRIHPSESLVAAAGEEVEIQVQAVWGDGELTDAVPQLVIEGASAADSKAAVSYTIDNGRVALRAAKPGYWPINVRLGSVVRTLQFWAHSDSERYQSPQQSPTSVDECVALALARVGEVAVGMAPNHILARRLWVDLAGSHPNPVQWKSAVEALQQGRKADLVDELLGLPEFAGRAGQELASWTASPNSHVQSQLAVALADYFHSNDNLLDAARSMLEVQEGSQNPLAVFHRLANDPRGRTELVATTFMGVRIGCAQCHDHPLDHWTQNDYFGMAACWAEIEAGPEIKRMPGRRTTDLRNGRPATARLPGERQSYSGDAPPDVALSDWLCSEDNSLFKRNVANRVWFWFFDRGLINEVDDQRATNPPINPELLEHLVQTLEDEEFSLRALVKEVVMSDAYGRLVVTDGAELRRQLLAVRRPKGIPQSISVLASTALGIAVERDAIAAGEANAMMMAPAEPSCTRGVVCDDPTTKSLRLVAGEELDIVIRRALAENPNLDFSQQMGTLYERLFGTSMPADVADSIEELRKEASSAEASSEVEREVAEDVLWSWIVSPDFFKLN